MNAREQDTAARQYFAERYEVIAHHPLVAPRPILLPLDDPEQRQCRFCGRGTSQAKFKNDAHAVSHLLGVRDGLTPQPIGRPGHFAQQVRHRNPKRSPDRSS